MMSPRAHRGYSLLELIVSLGIFSMAMLVVMAAYISLISLDRQARAGSQLAASLSFGIETMARSMRTGTNYDCGSTGGDLNCVNGSDEISFTDSEGETIRYRLKSDGSIGQCAGGGSCLDNNAISLTDPKINITSLRFYVRGVGNTTWPENIQQPTVIFTVAGTMNTSAGESTSFSIQTASTQRLIEL